MKYTIHTTDKQTFTLTAEGAAQGGETELSSLIFAIRSSTFLIADTEFISAHGGALVSVANITAIVPVGETPPTPPTSHAPIIDGDGTKWERCELCEGYRIMRNGEHSPGHDTHYGWTPEQIEDSYGITK